MQHNDHTVAVAQLIFSRSQENVPPSSGCCYTQYPLAKKCEPLAEHKQAAELRPWGVHWSG